MIRRWNFSSLLLLAFTALALSVAAPLSAQAQSAGFETGKNGRFDLSIGVQSWGALADLTLAGGGEIKQGGVGVGGGGHWLMKRTERVDLLFGVDAYVFGNSTSARYGTSRVKFKAFHVSPSMKLAFDDGDGWRYLLGFGLGYYDAYFKESDVDAEWWGEAGNATFWDDTAMGAYISFDVDFPRRNRESENGAFLSARVHSVDFGPVRDERPEGLAEPVLGPNAGQLKGPLVVLHFGYQWHR